MRELLPLCAAILVSGIAHAGEAATSRVVPPQAAQNNPGVAQELGLSAAEEATLFGILDRHQADQRELIDRIEGEQDAAVRVTLIQQQVPLQRQRDESIARVLGPSRYSRWQDYERTRTPRLQAATMASTLARSGLPLDATQQQAILKALIDAHARHQQQIAAGVPANAIKLTDVTDPDFNLRLRDHSVASLEDSQRRTREAVAPHLDARQLEALRSLFTSPARIPGVPR